MSQLWNPYAFSVTGQPVALAAPPALRVYGGTATAEQLAAAQAAYARFCTHARLSHVPNPTEIGRLSDGSVYRIVVVGNTTIMELRVAPVQAQETGSSGVLILHGGAETMLVPSGRFAAPDGGWKSVTTSGRQYSRELPHFSWHAQTGGDYFVSVYLAGPTERDGALALQGLVADGIVQSTMFQTQIAGQKMTAIARRRDERAWLTYGVAPDIPKGYSGPAKLVDYVGDATIATAAAPEYITGVAMHPGGSKAMVTVVKYMRPSGPDGTMYESAVEFMNDLRWTPTVNTPYGGYAVYPKFIIANEVTTVDEYSRAGDAWELGDRVMPGAQPSSSPAVTVRKAYPVDVVESDTLRWEVLQKPVVTYSGLDGACPIGGFAVALVFSQVGPLHYRERQEFDSGDVFAGGVAVGGDTPAIGIAQYTPSGGASVTPRRYTSSYEFDLEADVSSRAWGRYWCPEGEWMAANEDRSLTASSGVMTRRRRIKLVVTLGGAEFVLRDDDLSEAITFSEDHTSQYNYALQYPQYTADYKASADLTARMVHRKVLEYDHQFDMVCYLEVKCDVSRTASGRLVGQNTGGEWENAITGGDKAPPPDRPVANVVISVGGVEKFRAPVPARPDTEENKKVAFDSTFPYENVKTFSVVRMKGEAENIQHVARAWRAVPGGGATIDLAESSGTTYMTRVAPYMGHLLGPSSLLDISGGDYLGTKYAKDPRTGGGVLHIGSSLVDSPFFRAFLITPNRAAELAAVAPSIAPETITAVAPT